MNLDTEAQRKLLLDIMDSVAFNAQGRKNLSLLASEIDKLAAAIETADLASSAKVTAEDDTDAELTYGEV